MTQTLPTAAEVATLPAERLNELAANAMDWHLGGTGMQPRWWVDSKSGQWVVFYKDWHPATDANQAIEVAERVFADEPSFTVMWFRVDNIYLVQSGYGAGESPEFAEALTRAAVAAWIARH